MLAVGAALLVAGTLAGGSRSGVRKGGTFRIAYINSLFTSIDPALALWGLDSEQFVEPTCGQLLNFPDRNPPAGLRIRPELASGYTVSADGRRYTFTIRPGQRFSNGAPVKAQNFAHAFVRVLAPSMQSYGASLLEEVVGAKEAPEGQLPAGISARGNRLVIRLARPVPDFAARMTLSLFCAVPSNLPIDPEGVGAPLHAAGPYYVAEYVPGRRLVLERNRYYRGSRPHHVDRFVVDFTAADSREVIQRVKRGTADWGIEDENGFPKANELRGSRSQFYVRAGHGLFGFYLNSGRPLFRNNARLRRAVNFAVDRSALLREFGGRLTGRLTDQYLPPTLPEFRDARIYPLRKPSVKKAKALARGRLRSGKAVLYIRDDPIYRSQAQVLKRNLAAIGLEVEITVWSPGAYYRKVFQRGEPWDIAQVQWIPDYPDPYSYLNLLFHSSSGSNPSFASSKYDRLLTRAARLHGTTRYRTYGNLDVRLARDGAMVAAFYANVPTFVSRRVDPRCMVLRPYLDLAAVCLKR